MSGGASSLHAVARSALVSRVGLLTWCLLSIVCLSSSTDDEIQEMIDEADRDNDGKINAEEFFRVMKVRHTQCTTSARSSHDRGDSAAAVAQQTCVLCGVCSVCRNAVTTRWTTGIRMRIKRRCRDLLFALSPFHHTLSLAPPLPLPCPSAPPRSN